MVDDVSMLVELHLRFHTYKMGWSDKAVRRYVRDAGHLLDELNELTAVTARHEMSESRRSGQSDGRTRDSHRELREQEDLSRSVRRSTAWR